MEIENKLDFINADRKFQLNQISSDDITIAGVDTIWDGPLSGDCIWKNDPYFFFSFDQLVNDGSNDQWPNKYILIKLNSEQKEKLNKWRMNNIGTFKIEPEQLVGWFQSKDENGKESKFLESYFSWKENH